MSAAVELRLGHTYRAKRPAPAGSTLTPQVNDRTIVWLGVLELQYDGPSVANGRHYPRVSREAFTKWAARDVTDELPPDAYAPWPPSAPVQQAPAEVPASAAQQATGEATS